MKTFVITLIMGIFMVCAGNIYTYRLENESRMLTGLTTEIESAIKNDDFDTAGNFLEELDNDVKKFEKFFLATGDHLETDNIKINISELKAFIHCGEKSEALSKTYVLEFLFSHLPNSSHINIGNIL